MDAQASPSHLPEAQPSDVIIPISPQPRQPTDGSFANAHHFEIKHSLFYDIRGGFHQHTEKTGNGLTSISPLSLSS
jgi:hypothetical protein